MSPSAAGLRATPVRVFVAVVVANYAMQILYALHLYGTAFSRTGALLLGATLVWFIGAVGLFRAGRRAGYWLLLAYAAAQLLFYFVTEVVLSFRGFGLPYHLSQTQDAIVWLTFLVGDVNGIAAVFVTAYLLRDRRALRPAGFDA